MSNEDIHIGTVDNKSTLVSASQFWRRWAWLLIINTILCGIIAAFYVLGALPIYRATSTLYYMGYDLTAPQPGDNIMHTRALLVYANLMMHSPQLEAVATRLNLDPAFIELDVTQLAVTLAPDTQLLEVTVEGPATSLNVLIANTLPEVFNEYLEEMNRDRFAEARNQIQYELAHLEQEIEAVKDEIRNLEETGNEEAKLDIADLHNSLELAQINYEHILRKLEEINGNEKRSKIFLEILEPAEMSTEPIHRNIPLNILATALIGGLVALGFAFFTDGVPSPLVTFWEHMRSDTA